MQSGRGDGDSDSDSDSNSDDSRKVVQSHPSIALPGLLLLPRPVFIQSFASTRTVQYHFNASYFAGAKFVPAHPQAKPRRPGRGRAAGYIIGPLLLGTHASFRPAHPSLTPQTHSRTHLAARPHTQSARQTHVSTQTGTVARYPCSPCHTPAPFSSMRAPARPASSSRDCSQCPEALTEVSSRPRLASTAAGELAPGFLVLSEQGDSITCLQVRRPPRHG